MAAKSKKRLSKIENKLLKLETLELNDVLCSICQSILIEPVTLPCFHDFCHICFNGSIENNALCCPLCRLRIGSWLRTSTKQKNLINVKLWNFIKSKFPKEIDIKTRGEEINLPEEKPLLRLSKPGEIRSEYEAELTRLRAERLQLEQRHFEETELLINKIQQEEEEAHKKYLENLKQDEMLALQMQHEHIKPSVPPPNTPRKLNLKRVAKPRLKATKIDGYMSKIKTPAIKDSPLLTDDNTSTDSSTPKAPTAIPINGVSPEMVPRYGKLINNLLERKNKLGPSLWNKENGETVKEKKEDSKIVHSEDKSTVKTKSAIPSLLVSLPLPCMGLRHHRVARPDNRNLETGSADSMRQELCYFKPIEGTTPTSFNTGKGLPLRVPALRADKETPADDESSPTREQYLEGLCRLRNVSLAKNLPSAFVIALNMLKVTKESPIKCETNLRSKVKKTASTSPCVAPTLPVRRNPNRNKHSSQITSITKINNKTNLRRTRSMGSISKDENETTPKKSKIKQRKVSSERKPYLRSDSKRLNAHKGHSSPPLISESINNNKVNLAVKNLSSPLKNCDVKKILQEQLRIEKIIEQEKNDFELARKMEAEWNGRRQPRRAAIKRQVSLNYALRPAKKLKV